MGRCAATARAGRAPGARGRGPGDGCAMTEIAAAWPCEAYGPEGMAAGFWCFFSGEVSSWRDCGTEAVCHARMTGERVRVFDRLRQLAAAGDDIAIAVLAEINSPADLRTCPPASVPRCPPTTDGAAECSA